MMADCDVDGENKIDRWREMGEKKSDCGNLSLGSGLVILVWAVNVCMCPYVRKPYENVYPLTSFSY